MLVICFPILTKLSFFVKKRANKNDFVQISDILTIFLIYDIFVKTILNAFIYAETLHTRFIIDISGYIPIFYSIVIHIYNAFSFPFCFSLEGCEND